MENKSPIDLLSGVDNMHNIFHQGFKALEGWNCYHQIFGYIVTGSYNEVTVLHLINLTLSVPQGHQKKRSRLKVWVEIFHILFDF